MAEWWWRVRYAYWFRHWLKCGWCFAWASAEAAERDGDESPKDAADNELSYWNEDDGD